MLVKLNLILKTCLNPSLQFWQKLDNMPTFFSVFVLLGVKALKLSKEFIDGSIVSPIRESFVNYVNYKYVCALVLPKKIIEAASIT